jgi:hypothetical protein
MSDFRGDFNVEDTSYVKWTNFHRNVEDTSYVKWTNFHRNVEDTSYVKWTNFHRNVEDTSYGQVTTRSVENRSPHSNCRRPPIWLALLAISEDCLT